MNMQQRLRACRLALCARRLRLALAQASAPAPRRNSIEALDVAQQGGKVVVRVTTKEPLQARAAELHRRQPGAHRVRLSRTPCNALGRSSQDIGQGELRSMNVVQARDRTRLVLNLRRPVAHEATLDGRTRGDHAAEAVGAAQAPGGQVAHFAEGRADAKHAIRDIDFRRGRAGEGRVVVDLSDTSTGIDIRQQGQNIVVDFLKTALPDNLRRRLDVIDFGTPVQHRQHLPAGRERAHGDRAARASGSTTPTRPTRSSWSR